VCGGGFNEGVESVPQRVSLCVGERKREKLEREREL